MTLTANRDIATPARVSLEAGLEAVFAQPFILADLALDDRAKNAAVGRIGEVRIESNDAPFNPPGHSDDAEIRPDVIDDGSLLRVTHRGAGDAKAARDKGQAIGPEADFAHAVDPANRQLGIPELPLRLREPAADRRQYARVVAGGHIGEKRRPARLCGGVILIELGWAARCVRDGVEDEKGQQTEDRSVQ